MQNAVLYRVHQVKTRTRLARTYKTKSEFTCLQAASACLHPCQKIVRRSIGGITYYGLHICILTQESFFATEFLDLVKYSQQNDATVEGLVSRTEQAHGR